MERYSSFSDFLEQKGRFRSMNLNEKEWSIKFVWSVVQESGELFKKTLQKASLLIKYQHIKQHFSSSKILGSIEKNV